MVENVSLAHILRTKRRERNLTQEALAAEVGVSRSHIAMLETGGDLPGRETLVAIFTHLDIPFDLLAAALRKPGEKPLGAKAADEEEALWLHAFRHMDVQERKALLSYALTRTKAVEN